MSLKEVHGDVIVTARKIAALGDREVLLPHVCNNVGVMGAGVAAALAKAFPGVDREYARYCSEHDDVLGETITEHVEPHIFVMNMICQAGFNNGGEPPLRYGALVHCMESVLRLSLTHDDMGVKTVIVAPRFGAGLAGGDWGVIRSLIVEIWVAKGRTVIISNYP